jgi:hypothetical protein
MYAFASSAPIRGWPAAWLNGYTAPARPGSTTESIEPLLRITLQAADEEDIT